jgi:hypothetical protein
VLWRCGSLVGWENEAGEECSINAMAPLFEVYREAERADIKKEKKQRFIDPMRTGPVPWICKKRSATFW